MNNDLRIKIKVDSNTGELIVTRKEFDKLGKSVKTTEKQVSTMSKNATKSFDIMKTAIVGIISAQAFQAIARYSDAWTGVEGRLKLVTNGTSDLIATQKALFAVAEDSRQSYEATATLYTRMARATRNLGIDQTELLRTTETINKALIVSGASASESSSTILQLSQALASGVLRGEEFNSISENGSEILNILGDSLGKTTGELRAMAMEGKLTTTVVLKALADGAESVDEKFKSMNLTISQATQSFSNNVGRIIAGTEKTTGAMSNIATSIKWTGDNLDNAGNIFTTLGRGMSPFLALYADYVKEKDKDYIASMKSIEANEEFIKQMKIKQGIIKKDVIPLSIATEARSKEVALFLGVEADTLKGLTDQEINFAEASKIANDTRLKSLEIAQDEEASDMAYYASQIAIIEAINAESQAINDNTNQKLANATSTEKVTEATNNLAVATSWLYDIQGNLRTDSSSSSSSYFDEGYSYTVTTANVIDSFNTTIDDSTSYVDSFNTTINTVDDSLQDFQSAIDDISSSLSSSMSSLYSISTSDASTSYLQSYINALDSREALLANPLSAELSSAFSSDYSDFTTASSDYLSSNSFVSLADQEFATATVGQQDDIFKNTALLTYDVQEETKNLLASIDTAIADGILTTEEKATISGVADSVNTKNDLLLGSSGIVATSLTGIDSSVNSQTYFDNTGLATDANISLQDYYDNLLLAKDTSLIGTNSVTDALNNLDSTVDMTTLEDITADVGSAVGISNTTLASIGSYTSATNTNVSDNLSQASLSGKIKQHTSTTTPALYASNGVLLQGEKTTANYTYYAQGGFTGNGKGQTDSSGFKQAGIVHENEWVAPKWMVQNNPSLFGALEMHRLGKSSVSSTSSSNASSNGSSNKTDGYLYVLQDEMKQMNFLLRQLTDGGNAMKTKAVS